MRLTYNLALACVVVFNAATTAHAEPTAVVGNHVLQPNLPGQVISFFVSGIDPSTVNGMHLGIAVAGGGPTYGGTLGPKITDIDVDSGPSIWDPPNSAGHVPPTVLIDPGGQLASVDLTTTFGYVNVASGVLVSVTFDTSSLPIFASWEVALVSETLDQSVGSSYLNNDENNIGTFVNGSIGSVPEPSALVLGLSGLTGMALVIAGKRRAGRRGMVKAPR